MRIPFFTSWLIRRRMRDLALTALVHSDTHLHEKVNDLVALNRRRELLVVAAQHFADVFADSLLAHYEGERLNERQMSALTELLRAAGLSQAADTWQSYALPDEEDQDQEQTEPVSV